MVYAMIENRQEAEDRIEGKNAVMEALKAGRPIDKVYLAKGEQDKALRFIAQKAKAAGAVISEVDRRKLDFMSVTHAHQGVIAVAALREYVTVADILASAKEKGEAPLVVVCAEISDPHNLGAIIRTAECVGAHGVIIPERRSVGLTPAAVKASAGACEYMKTVKVGNINRTIDELKERGVWIAGAAMDGDNAFAADLTGPIALVVGAEGDGISELTMKKCDLKLSLPMKGHIDSLNASVAAGVLMYAVMNARNK